MPQNLRIDRMVYGVGALARLDGTGDLLKDASFPFVLPDELIQIGPQQEVAILEASPDRVAPGCIHFGTCGGCHYQHAAYPAQLRIKQAILEDALNSVALTDLPAIKVHSADPWHYRNRIRLRIGVVDGELRAGYNRYDADGGEPLLPITMCPIAAPVLWQAVSSLLELAKTDLNIQSWLRAAIEVELFTNAGEASLQLILFTRKPSPASFAAFCVAAQRAIPQLTGAGVAILPGKPSPQGRRWEHAKPGAQWGASGLLYNVEEYSYWVGRGGFFQINRHLVSSLAQLATAGRGGKIAWDLYAGVGLFSRTLARSFAQVTGVEPAEPSVTGLAGVLRPPHRAMPLTTLDFLQAAVVQRERPELIVMDPPRAGLGREVCELLARIGAPELVYISCDPLTLARDLRDLTASGYKITELHLVDMFPQTFHMETVATLRR